jgi:hypothetical protein
VEDPDKPWVQTSAQIDAVEAQAEAWFKTATPADRRRLWDYVTVSYADRVLDVTTDLAQLMFMKLFQRFPELAIGDGP